MDFTDRVKAHAKRVVELKDHATTEEATKTGLIMPFLRVLGYDTSDPRVVIPEFCADFGEKKACKVDYAIKRGDDILIIVEAKKVGAALDGSKEGQLQQYFQSLLPVKIAILTDGVIYKYYTDLENPNVMDKKPFMVFDFMEMEEALIPELKKLCCDCFDLGTALYAAQELKYLGALRKAVAVEMEKPSDETVRLFASMVYDGRLTSNVVETFRERVRIAFEHHINEVINARLQSAMHPSSYPGKQAEEAALPESAQSLSREERIVTTEEEIEGYHIVKAIMRKVVAPERVVMRDTISYCGVLLDDNNRKPICRLHFNSPSVKYLETFDLNRSGTKHRIEDLNDIFKHADALRAVIGAYERE